MKMFKRLHLFLCVAGVVFHGTAAWAPRRTRYVSADHCRRDMWPSVPADQASCLRYLNSLRQSLSHVIHHNVPGLNQMLNAVFRVSDHSSGEEETVLPPVDVISAYNHLTNASLSLLAAERLLGIGHDYSNSVRDPLRSLGAILGWNGWFSDSVQCSLNKTVRYGSHTEAMERAPREVANARHHLMAVLRHVRNPVNWPLFCGRRDD